MKYYEKEKLGAVQVQDAVGQMLVHDVTQIIPDLFKGPKFRKGHIITDADVQTLLDMGKQHIYVSSLEGEVHEDEAAMRIARAALGKNLNLSSPKEGKVEFTATCRGLLKINLEGLEQLNSITDIIFSSLHTNQAVEVSQTLAGTRIIPLSIEEELVEAAEQVCQDYFPLIEIAPFAALDVGLVVTGSEVYSGRIRDGFGPVVQKKFETLGSRIMEKRLVSDDLEMTVAAIHALLDDGAQMIAVTGGMSVDPDDLTPAAIRAAGGEIIAYGVPVLPGAMFMLAQIQEVPVIGLPGCVMYHRISIFDLIVPRLLAGDTPSQSDINKMGHGGFCSNCTHCRFPACGFGK